MNEKINAWLTTHKYVTFVTIVAMTSLIKLHRINKHVVIFSQDLHGL